MKLFADSRDPDDGRARWRRRPAPALVIGLLASFLVHTVALASMAVLYNCLTIHPLPPPSGATSIQLVASQPALQQPQFARTAEVELPATGPIKLVLEPSPSRRVVGPSNPLLAKDHERWPPTNEAKMEIAASWMTTEIPLVSFRRVEIATRQDVDISDPTPEHHKLQRAALASFVTSRRNSGVQTDRLPSKIENLSPPPVYPPDELAQQVNGSVDLRVRVGSNGRVLLVTVYRSSGRRAFDEAARLAIQQWRFQPARLAGVAVTKDVLVGIDFVIQR